MAKIPPDRLAAALRANLKRRKAAAGQSPAKKTETPASPAPPPAPPAPKA